MSEKVLRLLASVYLAGYLVFIVAGLIENDITVSTTEGLSVLFLLLFFMVGYMAMWFNSNAAGIMLLVWHFSIWIFSLFTWEDAGGALLMAFPVLIIGVFLILNTYIKSGGGKRSDDLQWKFAFRLLLVNFTVLYLVLILSDLLTRNLPDLMTWPFILYPVLLIIFLTAVILSWKNAKVAGILFVLWFLIIVTGTVFYPEFSQNGPLALLGFPVLLQGLLYFKQRIDHL